MLCRFPSLICRSTSMIFKESVTNYHVSAVLVSNKSSLATLRKKTGYSLSICKKALSETDQDIIKAEAWLKDQAQAQGWAKAQKLQGRNTSQGQLGVLVKDNCGTIVELNCETDFVAKNKKFASILETIASTCIKLPPTDNTQDINKINLTSAEVGSLKVEEGSSLADLVALNIGQIGENMALGNAVVIHGKEGGNIKLAGLSHPHTDGDLDRLMVGRFTALMAYTKSGQGVLPDGTTEERLVAQICQHIIGMAPTAVRNDEDKENSLMHQPFLLDEDKTVGELTQTAGITVLDFIRREIGRHE